MVTSSRFSWNVVGVRFGGKPMGCGVTVSENGRYRFVMVADLGDGQVSSMTVMAGTLRAIGSWVPSALAGPTPLMLTPWAVPDMVTVAPASRWPLTVTVTGPGDVLSPIVMTLIESALGR